MTDDATYLTTLLEYFEEEIEGEAYFYALADHFDGEGEREKLVLMAKVERRAAEAVRPLVDKHGLAPRDESVLKTLGRAGVGRHENFSWGQLMEYISIRYPGYVDDFERLERIAPEDDLPALKILTLHEVAAIEFANREIAGDPDSLAPLREYLESLSVQVGIS